MSFIKEVEQKGLLASLMNEWSKFTAPSSAGTPSLCHQVITLSSSVGGVLAGVLALPLNLPIGVVTIGTSVVHFLSNLGDYLAKYDTPAVNSTPTSAGTSASSVSQAQH